MGTAGQSQPDPTVLDHVVAVVNNRAILQSDVDNAMRLAALEPRQSDTDTPNPQAALQRLISRTLIQQQIRQEDVQAATPSEERVEARLAELRRELPACVRMNCASDAGWAAFLASNHLTAEEAANYLRTRLEILGFIESRFRQGIRISQDEIETYYHDTLLPQYAKGAQVPQLKDVSPRIEEILLQQQVSAMFSAWLDNLRKQGDVEILDPTLEPPGTKPSESEKTE